MALPRGASSIIEKFVVDMNIIGTSGIRTRFETYFRRLALELARRIILKTPVDTGQARGNWFATTGAVPANSFVKGETDRPGDRTIARAAAEVEKGRMGTKIRLYNGVPYIRALENGRSGQAPNGMVALSIAEVQALGLADDVFGITHNL